mmetsp:Transcript_6502/g.22884  ORF Transcript_6502/g.22884 Transcript_6502/m.22884 type:complete len:319 (-) Transcript_6502:711-1667(-)
MCITCCSFVITFAFLSNDSSTALTHLSKAFNSSLCVSFATVLSTTSRWWRICLVCSSHRRNTLASSRCIRRPSERCATSWKWCVSSTMSNQRRKAWARWRLPMERIERLTSSRFVRLSWAAAFHPSNASASFLEVRRFSDRDCRDLARLWLRHTACHEENAWACTRRNIFMVALCRRSRLRRWLLVIERHVTHAPEIRRFAARRTVLSRMPRMRLAISCVCNHVPKAASRSRFAILFRARHTSVRWRICSSASSTHLLNAAFSKPRIILETQRCTATFCARISETLSSHRSKALIFVAVDWFSIIWTRRMACIARCVL